MNIQSLCNRAAGPGCRPLLFVMLLLSGLAVAAPALADNDGHHGQGHNGKRGHDQNHGHNNDQYRHWGGQWYGNGGGYSYAPAPGYARPYVYAQPVYVPPPVYYAPPPSPGISLFFPLDLR